MSIQVNQTIRFPTKADAWNFIAQTIGLQKAQNFHKYGRTRSKKPSWAMWVAMSPGEYLKFKLKKRKGGIMSLRISTL